jgi:hypothetical protein
MGRLAFLDRPDERFVQQRLLVRQPVAHASDATPGDVGLERKQIQSFGLGVFTASG